MSVKNNEFTREYIFNNPLMPPVICRPNCCLFCDECTDIYYDQKGPYGIVCLKGGDLKKGMLGKCEMFSEEQERSDKSNYWPVKHYYEVYEDRGATND